MSKLVEAGGVVATLGAAAGLILVLHGTTLDDAELDVSRNVSRIDITNIRPAFRPFACPTEPDRPKVVACWGEERPDGSNVEPAYSDCIDPKEISKCVPSNPGGTTTTTPTKTEPFNCPACIKDCVSMIGAEYEAAKADYDSKSELCVGGMVKNEGRCICLVDSRTAPPADEIDPDTIPASEKHVLYDCDGRQVWLAANVVAPARCVALTDAVASTITMSGVEMPLDKSLKVRCAPYPVYNGDHGACPTCVEWADGCPPCRLVADKYGADWRTHAGECSQEESP